MKDHFILAYKNLKHRGIRSWLTLLGIFIGIMAVVALVTLGGGLKSAVNSQFGISSTEIISVQAGGLNSFGPPGSGAVNKLTTEDAEAISKLNLVKEVSSRYIVSGKLEYKGKAIIGLFTSIPEGNERKFIYELLDIFPKEGRLLGEGDEKKVILGYNFFVNKVGLEKKIKIGNKIKINGEEFTVIGIINKKGSFLFDNAVYLKEDSLKKVFNKSNKIDLIAVKVKDKDKIDSAKIEIEKLLRDRREVKKGKEDFEVSTPQATLENVNNILKGIQIFIVIIAFISILVGALGIVNTMTTSVLERKKTIGIMKAIGAKNSDIFFQFFIESGLLGLIGGIFGIIAGLGIGYFGTLALNNFIGASTPPTFSLFLTIFVFFGSFFIGAISGISPALNAAKQNPVEALRG